MRFVFLSRFDSPFHFCFCFSSMVVYLFAIMLFVLCCLLCDWFCSPQRGGRRMRGLAAGLGYAATKKPRLVLAVVENHVPSVWYLAACLGCHRRRSTSRGLAVRSLPVSPPCDAILPTCSQIRAAVGRGS